MSQNILTFMTHIVDESMKVKHVKICENLQEWYEQNKLTAIKVLGKGTYGMVDMVKDKNNTFYACKMIPVMSHIEELREYNFLKIMQSSKYVVKVHAVFLLELSDQLMQEIQTRKSNSMEEQHDEDEEEEEHDDESDEEIPMLQSQQTVDNISCRTSSSSITELKTESSMESSPLITANEQPLQQPPIIDLLNMEQQSQKPIVLDPVSIIPPQSAKPLKLNKKINMTSIASYGNNSFYSVESSLTCANGYIKTNKVGIFVFEYAHTDLFKLMHIEFQLRKNQWTPLNVLNIQFGNSVIQWNNNTIKHLLKQLLCGVRDCHKHSVVHTDLKPSNLLINILNSTSNISGIQLKIADFGTACLTQSCDMALFEYPICTSQYRAPELLLGIKQFNEKIDMWSIGCIFAEMLTGEILFEPKPRYIDKSEIKVWKMKNFPEEHEFWKKNEHHFIDMTILQTIFSLLGTPCIVPKHMFKHFGSFNDSLQRPVLPDSVKFHSMSTLDSQFGVFKKKDFAMLFPNVDGKALHLLGKMLQINPSNRYSAIEALQHPFFQEK
jgi:serine/threonine protein kinase